MSESPGVCDLVALHDELEVRRQRELRRTLRRLDAAERRALIRRAAPSLLILAGCGCFAVSLWPDPLTLAGCGCFVVATLINLVGCVR